MQQLAAPNLSGPNARWRDEGRVSPEKNLQVQLLVQQFREGKLNEEQLKARVGVLLGRELLQLLVDEFLAAYASQLSPAPSAFVASSAAYASPAGVAGHEAPTYAFPGARPPPPSFSFSRSPQATHAASGARLSDESENGRKERTETVLSPTGTGREVRDALTPPLLGSGRQEVERASSSDRDGTGDETQANSPIPGHRTPQIGSVSPSPFETGRAGISPTPSAGTSAVASPGKSAKPKKDGAARKGLKSSPTPSLVSGALNVSEGEAASGLASSVFPKREGAFPTGSPSPGARSTAGLGALAPSRLPFASPASPAPHGAVGGFSSAQPFSPPAGAKFGGDGGSSLAAASRLLHASPSPSFPLGVYPRFGLMGARSQGPGASSTLSSEYRENMSAAWWSGAALGSDAWRQMPSSAEVLELVEKKKLTEQFRTIEGLVDRADFLGSLRLQGDGRSVLHFLGLSTQDLQQNLWVPKLPPILEPRLSPAPTSGSPVSLSQHAVDQERQATPGGPAVNGGVAPGRAAVSSPSPVETREAKLSRFRFPPQLVWERLRHLHPPVFSSLSSSRPEGSEGASPLSSHQPSASRSALEEKHRLLPSFSLLSSVAQELEGGLAREAGRLGTAESFSSSCPRGTQAPRANDRGGEKLEKSRDAQETKQTHEAGVTPEREETQRGQEKSVKGEGSFGEETKKDSQGRAASAGDDASPVSSCPVTTGGPSFASVDPYFDCNFSSSLHAHGLSVTTTAAPREDENLSDFSFAPLCVDRDAVADLARVTQAALSSLLASALSLARRRAGEEEKARQTAKVEATEEAEQEEDGPKRADACSRQRERERGGGIREARSEDEARAKDAEEDERKLPREGELGDRSSEEDDEGDKKAGDDAEAAPVAFASQGCGKRRPRHLWKPEGVGEAEPGKEETREGKAEASEETDDGPRDTERRTDTREARRSPGAESATSHTPAYPRRSGLAGEVEEQETKGKTRITVCDVLRALELHGGSIGSLLEAAEQRKRRRQQEVFYCMRPGTRRKVW